jgi:hypothetical protein
MATPPIDPQTQARLDALQAQVDKLTAGNRANSSRSGVDAATDFIKNDNISAKITAALDLLPTSITSSTVFKTSVGAITDAARLVGAIADQAVESADAVFNMYQSGVAIGMDQLSKTANDFGTSIDGLTKLLTKHGRVVSAMGIDVTARLGREFLALTHNGTDLGMSIDEANEAALAYAEVVNNSGKMQRYNSTLLADGAKNFSKAINDAAQASGRNVEQIRAETVSRLGQADSFYLQQSMSDAESAMFQTNMANMESFNSSINNTGAQLQDWMVQFESTGDISGIQDRAFTRALAATGTTDLFTKAMHQTGQEQKDTLAQIGGIMAQYAGENRALAGSRNPETRAMMAVIGNMGRDVNATTARAGKGVDKTAAGIEGTMAEFQKAAAAVNNAINDLAVAGFVKFKEALAAGTEAAGEFAGIVSRFGQSMLPSEGTIDTTPPGDIPATIDSYLNQLIPTQLQRPDEGGSDAERRAAALVGPGGSAQDFLNNNQSLFGSQNPDTQEILRIIAAQARTETVSATLSPAAAFNQSGNDIASGIATSFDRNPATGARIGSSIGMGILSYLNFDNIRAAIFGATPVTNNINTPNTNRQPDTDEIRMSAEIVSVAQQAQADRSEIQRQNMNMNTQLELMLSQLGMLNTNITDQTVALKNALSRSSNNVYT